MHLREQRKLLDEINQIGEEIQERQAGMTYEQLEEIRERYGKVSGMAHSFHTSIYPIAAKLLTQLDSKSRRSLMRRTRDAKGAKAFHDALRNLYHHQYRGLEVVLPDRASSWTDLEKKVNLACNRAAKLVEEQSRIRQEATELERAGWLATEAGRAWSAKQDELTQKQNERAAKSYARKLKKMQEENEELQEENEELHNRYTTFCETFIDSWEPNGARAADKALRYEIATSSEQLYRWGRASGNCIAGYNPDTLQTGSVLIGVHDTDNQLVACAQVALRRNRFSPDQKPRILQVEINHRYPADESTRQRMVQAINDALVAACEAVVEQEGRQDEQVGDSSVA